jgi:hypothetical protein
MLVLLGIVLFLIGSAIFVGARVLWYYMAKWEYREPFSVICPENMQLVEVHVDGDVAARSRFAGHEDLQVSACSRWPEKSEFQSGVHATGAVSGRQSPESEIRGLFVASAFSADTQSRTHDAGSLRKAHGATRTPAQDGNSRVSLA